MNSLSMADLRGFHNTLRQSRVSMDGVSKVPDRQAGFYGKGRLMNEV